jgi:hypothetical protein
MTVKTRLPILVQDPDSWRDLQDHPEAGQQAFLPLAEGAEFDLDLLMDGPATDRVVTCDNVVVRLNPDPKPKIKYFFNDSGQNILEEYRQAEKNRDIQQILSLVYSPEFILVSTFACILRTISLFERKNVLGRPIQWQFSTPLECKPRYATGANAAFYSREKCRIGFKILGEKKLYTSLSREAVAHETAHAVIDGINPHLYTKLQPYSYGIHEFLADITSLFVTIKSEALMKHVMAKSSGSIDNENEFSAFAENIGKYMQEGENFLRTFNNTDTYEEVLRTYQQNKDPGEFLYALGQILGGTVWQVIKKCTPGNETGWPQAANTRQNFPIRSIRLLVSRWQI